MKKILLTILWLVATFFNPVFMQVAPDIEWRKIDHPEFVINAVIAHPFNPSGGDEPVLGAPQMKVNSGEDWWYDIESFQTEEESGYYVSGFATWVNIQLDETLAGGLFDNNDGLPDCNRPILEDEILSQKLATVAKYDEDGTMIWCKPICKADEGAIALSITSDGAIIFTGWGKPTITKDGVPIFYNPTADDPGYDLTDPTVPIGDRKAKMLVGKMAADGTLLWLNSYGAYDIGDPADPMSAAEVLSYSAIGYDLIETNSGTIRAVGYSQDKDDGRIVDGVFTLYRKIFIIDIEQSSGLVLDKRLAGEDDHNAQAHEIEQQMTVDGEQFLITGYQKKDAQGADAILFRIDQDMNQVEFGNDSWNMGGTPSFKRFAAVRKAFSGQGNNIGWDVKVLDNGKVAWAFIEKCPRCLYSGKNIGQGRVFLYDEVDPSNTKYINLQSVNTYGFEDIRAFDMKLGLISTQDGGFACVTSIAGKPNSAADITAVKLDLEDQVGFNCISGEDTNGDGNVDQVFDHAEVWGTDTYIAKFDEYGDLLWDKSFDSDDAEIAFYPGDYKEQECVYRIAENAEGALTIVGNTSHNKDDYYIAKLRSDCNTEYHIEPNAENIYEIAADETWDTAPPGGVLRVRGVVRIKSGATLTISGITVEFADSRKMTNPTKVIVEQGAKLIIENNAVLTALSICDDTPMWDGIQVWGNADEAQSYSQQGWVIMRNSTIEHAHVAINLWRPDHWAETGGVVMAYGSTFRNNRRSANFMNYVHTVGDDIEVANKSIFRNVDFIWDDDFRSSPLNHASLYKVTGVRFTGCHFSDDRTAAEFTSPYISGGHIAKCGIRSIDAKYYVNAACNAMDLSECGEDFESAPWNPSTFDNLDFGIYAANSSSIYPIEVKKSVFTNNLHGIYTDALNTPKIIFNRFYYTNVNNHYPFYTKYGLHLERTQNIIVEENDFRNTSGAGIGLCIGILCSELGQDNEMVRKNSFYDLFAANQAEGENRGSIGPGYPNGSVGLSFECNTNEQNTTDFQIIVSDEAGGLSGVRIDIGDFGQAAGNTFSTTAPNHFLNETLNILKYYWESGPDLEPITTTNVTKYLTPNSAQCASNFPSEGSGGTGLETAFHQVKHDLGMLMQEYDGYVSQGTSPPMQLEQEIIYLSSQKSQLAHLILASLYQENDLDMDLNLVEQWVQLDDDFLSQMQLIDLHIQKLDFNKAYTEINHLTSSMSSATPSNVQQEVSDFVSLKYIIMSALTQQNTLADLSENKKSQIRSIAASGKGIAKNQAQELLCFFYDECDYTVITNEFNALNENDQVEETISSKYNKVSPNPTTGKVDLFIENLEDTYQVYIYNLQGQLVKSLEANEPNTIIDLGNLQDGIYLLKASNGVETFSTRVVKM